MTEPSTTKLNWLETVRKSSGWVILLCLISTYLILTCAAAAIYHFSVPLTDKQVELTTSDLGEIGQKSDNKEGNYDKKTIIDSFYFAVVTGTTLGYGDLSPKNSSGKLVVIFHVLLSTAFFALSISIAFLKLLYPRNTIILSSKIIYWPQKNKLFFRVINVNRAKLINPEFRIVMAQHTENHGISNHVPMAKLDQLPPIGNHDFVISFSDPTGQLNEQLEMAKSCNSKARSADEESRFSIKVSITGSYGFTSYSHYHKYKVSDVQESGKFCKIKYPEQFHKKIRKYNSIENFWSKFHGVDLQETS